MFFFINKTEFLPVDVVPKTVKYATYLRSSAVLSVLFTVGAAAAYIVGIAATIVAIFHTREHTITAVISFVLALGFTLLAGWFGPIAEARGGLLEGNYRRYFVSSNNYSFTVLFTPVVREYLSHDPIRFMPLQQMLRSQKLVVLDHLLYSKNTDFEDFVIEVQTKRAIIEVIEEYCQGIGLDQPEYFSGLRQEIHDELTAEMEKHQEQFALANVELERLSG